MTRRARDQTLPTHAEIRDAVISETASFLDSQVTSPADINSGYCSDFARSVLFVLGFPDGSELPDFQIMNTAHLLYEPFIGRDFGDWSGLPVNRESLLLRFPASAPPRGLDWDDLDDLSAYSDFDEGHHTWIRLGDRHYDCEAPDGVENPFDLPIFKRNVAEWESAGRYKRSTGWVEQCDRAIAASRLPRPW